MEPLNDETAPESPAEPAVETAEPSAPGKRGDRIVVSLTAIALAITVLAAITELSGRASPQVQVALEQATTFPITLQEIRDANLSMKEALYWEAQGDGTVKCGLCPFNCTIAEGERGVCKVRANIDGR
ncbi:MAG: hypothetical protein ACYS47_09690, partial [Planctomycetota bacterium]